jgi:hypothetical protein
VSKLNVLTGNSKLLKSWPGKRVGSISRTPIKTCPGAPRGGCVFEGKRCYCIRLGKMYPSVRKHWETMDALGAKVWPMVGEAIKRQKVQVFRPFSSGGDFINQKDLDAFYAMCKDNPGVLFYAYTKSLHLDLWTGKPANVTVNQSLGGRYDSKVNPDYPVAVVGGTGQDASADDSLAATGRDVSLKAH